MPENNDDNILAKSQVENPTPDEVFGVRMNAKLTQKQAASIVHSATRTWQQWEAGDRRMHPGLFELFLLKTRQIELVALASNNQTKQE